MREPQVFCRAVMHEYERQWSRATGHSVRHPLRLKMDRLALLCDEAPTVTDFEARLSVLQASTDIGDELLADELVPLWRTECAGGKLPFTDG
jgi:hypothetical protein